VGYEFGQSRELVLKAMWPGWFPGRAHADIPGDVGGDGGLGARDADSVVWLEGRLDKMPGYAAVTSGTLDAVGTSLFYSRVLGKLVGTAGTKIYSDLDAGTPTDITGSVTVTAGVRASWADWRFGSNVYAIGTNGSNAPWKWTGSGNAALLGGSPPNGVYAASFQDAAWLLNTAGFPNYAYFSALGDPETWDTSTQAYAFDAPITGVGVLGDLLVVFKRDSIGVLYGSNNFQLTKINKFAVGVGCVAGGTITPARLGGRDVLVFQATSGWFAFDGSQNPIPISSSIAAKYSDASSVGRFSVSNADKATAAFDPTTGWLWAGVADDGDSVNSVLLVHDLNRLFTTPEGSTTPVWPAVDVPFGVAATYYSGSAHTVYFLHATESKVYKITPSAFTRAGAGYAAFWVSKTLDLASYFVCNEVNVAADPAADGTDLTVGVNLSLAAGDGGTGEATLTPTGDALDSTFLMDTSTLSGASFLYSNVQATDYGRFLQTTLRLGSDASARGGLYSVHFVLTPIGLDPNAGGGV
jgi:hypothetical protein